MALNIEMSVMIKQRYVWDLYIRMNHWLMVLLFSGLILTGKAEEDFVQWHFYMAYVLSALLLCRVLYGFAGGKSARFMAFIKGPISLYHYVKQMRSRAKPHYLGHNPLGAIMVVTLLGLMILQIASGLVSTDDVFWYGPMYEWVSEDVQEGLADWHRLLPDILLGLVACHILAVLVHEIALKERLVKAMFSGYKQEQHDTYQDQALFNGETGLKPIRFRLISMLSLSLLWLYWLWQLPI